MENLNTNPTPMTAHSQSHSQERIPVLLTGDIVPVFKHEGEWSTAVIESTKPALKGKLVFGGGHRDAGDATVEDAAIREGKEELGLTITHDQLQLFMVLSGLNRDVRPMYSKPATPEQSRLIDRATVVFVVEYEGVPADLNAGDDAAKVHVIALKNLMPEMMGYDHGLVVTKLKKRYGIK